MPLSLRRTNMLIALGAPCAVLMAAALSYKLGPVALAGFAAVAVAVVLIARPAWSVGLAVTCVVLFESNADSGISGPERLYAYVPGIQLTGAEALLGVAVVAVGLDVLRRRELRGAGLLTPAFVLIVAAIAAGAVTGAFAGSAPGDLVNGVRRLLAILIVPVLVLQCVRSREDLHRAIALAAVLVAIKAAIGLILVAGGRGVPIGSGHITFIEAPANLLMMVFLLSVAGAVLMRVPVSRLAIWALPLVFACLLLSYRRSFWLGVVGAGALLIPLASGRTGRRVLLPALIVLAGAAAAAFSSGVLGAGLEGSIGKRIQSLQPTQIRHSRDDQYRVDERRNVWAEIRAAPITGRGLGQPWRARRPLSLTFEGAREYVHFTALWWWLKFGILGLAAYIAWTATLIATGLTVWRRHPDAIVRACGLGAGLGIVGLAIAELTGTFAGADPRSAIVIGALAGLLEAARRDAL